MIAPRALRTQANSLSRSIFGGVPLAIWERAFPKDSIALCYHMVSDENLEHFQLFSYKNAAQFEADVAYAKPRAITYQMLVDHRLRGAPLPPNGILFTFDDGFAECFTVIRPILLRHGVDGVFFVTTDFVDDEAAFFESTLSLCAGAVQDVPAERLTSMIDQAKLDDVPPDVRSEQSARADTRLGKFRLHRDGDPQRERLYRWLLGLSADDVDELARAVALLGVEPGERNRQIFLSRAQIVQMVGEGFTIGAHGLNHHGLEYVSEDVLEAQIVGSCAAVRAITGTERVPFAFPYSGLAISRKRIAQIMAHYPEIELIFDSGCLRRDSRFVVNRVFVDEPTVPDATNVPTALRDAWAVPSAWFRATGS